MVNQDRKSVLIHTPIRHSLTSQLSRLAVSVFLAGLFLCMIMSLTGVPSSADTITIWKTVTDTVKAGDPFTYTIYVHNWLTSTNSFGTIYDTLPSGVNVISAGGGTVTGDTISWPAIEIPLASTISRTLVVSAATSGAVVNGDYRINTGVIYAGAPVTTTIIPANPEQVHIVVTPDPATVDSSATFTVTLADFFGNTITQSNNVSIEYSKGFVDAKPAGTVITATTINGALTKSITDTIVGTTRITASVGSFTGYTDFDFAAGTPASIQVNVSPASIIADGAATAVVTATLYDQYANPVPSAPVSFSSGLGTISGDSSTNALGQAGATLYGTTAGTSVITVTSGALENATQNVIFLPGPPDHLALQGNPAAIAADGVSTSTVTLSVLDLYDNPINSSIVVTLTTDLGTFDGCATSCTGTTTTGVVEKILTAGTQIGTAHLYATIDLGLSTATTIDFTPGPPNHVSIEINPPTLVANGTSTATITTTVRDSFNNPVASVESVRLSIGAGRLITETGGVILTGPGAITSTTNNVGTKVWYLQSTSNLTTSQISANVNGLSLATSAITFTVGPPTIAAITLNPNPPLMVGATSTLTATVWDNWGHLVPNSPVTLVSWIGAQFLPDAAGNTDSAGQIRRTLVSTVAGNENIGVWNGSDYLLITNVVFMPDLPVQATLVASPSQIYADGESTTVISTTVADRFGNPVSGYTPAFVTTKGTLSGSGATDTSGVTTRTLRSSTDLTTAAVSVTGLTTVTGTTVDFIVGPVYTATLYSASSLVEVDTMPVNMVITVTDKVGHLITNQTLAVTSTIGTLSGSGCFTSNGLGQLNCTLNSTQSGLARIYVEGVLAAGSSVQFLSGNTSYILISPYGTPITPTNVTAGNVISFTATAYDQFGNSKTGISFGWSTVDGGGTGTINPATGVFLGTRVGNVWIIATGDGRSGSSLVNVKVGPAAKAAITADPKILPANDTKSNLTFQVTDFYNNPVGEGIGLVVGSSLGTVEGSSVTGATGRLVRTIKSTQAGTAVLTVTNIANFTLTGDKVVTFTSGVPNRAIITPSLASIHANGIATSTLRVTVLDQNNNPVGAGYPIQVIPSLGTVSGSTFTDNNGVVTRTLTAPYGIDPAPRTASFVVEYYHGIWDPLTVNGSVQIVVGPLLNAVITPAEPLTLTAGVVTTFTVRGFDATGAPIPASVPLDYGWSQTDGAGAGELVGSVNQSQVAFVGTLKGSGVRVGATILNAPYVAVTGINMTISPAPPVTATLAVNPASVVANPANVITFTLTNLKDAFGNTASDGEPVRLTVHTQPSARIATGVITGQQLIVSTNATIRAGVYTISATSDAGSMALLGTSSVTFNPGPPAQAEVITATPAGLIANGTSTSQFVVEVQDQYGNSVGGGVSPMVTTTLGTILTGGGTTDANGVVTHTLQSVASLGTAAIYVDGVPALGLTIPFIPGPPVAASLSITQTTLAVGGQSVPVIIDVRDNWNNPVADGTVITPTISPADRGTFSGLLQTRGGLVTATLSTGTSVGAAIVGVSNMSATGNTSLTIVPGPAANALVVANPTTSRVSLTSTVALTVTITDQYGNPVTPTAITMGSALGVLDNTASVVTKSTAAGTGLFTAILTSTVAGTDTFSFVSPDGPLTVNPASNRVEFLPDQPISVTIEPPGPIIVRINIPQVITASSRDKFGNASDTWSPVGYTWHQSSAGGSPGYGILNGVGDYARWLNFIPLEIGGNTLWATGGVEDSDPLTVTVIAGYASSATAAVTPGSVPTETATPFTVTLTNVRDVYGNPLSDGAVLTVTINSTPQLVKSGTLSGGVLNAKFTSNTYAGNHLIQVTGAGGAVSLSGATTVAFLPGAPVRAHIDATPELVPADGASTVALVVTIRDTNLNLVADNIPITVTASLGTITGTGRTASGKVNRTLVAPAVLGTAGFTVDGPNGGLFVTGDTVVFGIGEPELAWVKASPAKVIADGVSLSTLVITITDKSGYVVENDKATILSVTRGRLVPTTTVAVNGVLSSTFTSDLSVGSAGLAVLYNGVPMTLKGDALTQVPGPPVSATLTATLTSMAVGSAQQSTLNLTFRDALGRPIDDGSVVTVTTSIAHVVSNASTSVNGVVTRVLTPGTTMGTVNFSVKVHTPRGEVVTLTPTGDTVEVVPGGLDHIGILPGGPLNITAGSVITLTAIGYDRFDNDLGMVNFKWLKWYGFPQPGNGTLWPAAEQLSKTGVFTAVTAGQIGIKAYTDTNGYLDSNMLQLTIQPGAVATATVSATPKSIPVGGEKSDLVITLRDAYNNLVSNGTAVTVVSDIGTLVGSGTTIGGQITRTFISDIYYGTVNIFVKGIKAGGDQIQVDARSMVTANPPTLYADGTSQTTLTIELFDPPAGTTPPIVSSSLGTISGGTGFIGDSYIFTRTLRASTEAGLAQIFVDGFQAQGGITITVGLPAVARITSDATVRMDNGTPMLIANGTSATNLSIRIYDAYGHVITNPGSLIPSTSLGTLSGISTLGDGIITAKLTASTGAGKANLSVGSLAVTGDTEIFFVGDLSDGDFETDLNNTWQLGGVYSTTLETETYPVYTATQMTSDYIQGILVTSFSGGKMLRLGASTNNNNYHKVSEVWVRQPIAVPADGNAQLQFRYRMLSYDVAVGAGPLYKEWDPFEVYINGQRVLREGLSWSPAWQDWYVAHVEGTSAASLPSPQQYPGNGWEPVTLDKLTPYAGQIVTLEFRVPNRQSAVDNTWVYIDDIQVTEKPKMIFLPMVIK